VPEVKYSSSGSVAFVRPSFSSSVDADSLSANELHDVRGAGDHVTHVAAVDPILEIGGRQQRAGRAGYRAELHRRQQ